ncbi:MAG: pyruvate formate-lyase activating enzyme [Deltaproteobacteria bacterium]|nr:MAG: pyruvate formate-lyase activating enzyme [Deltaproteobacteria bacterium]
MSRFLILDIGAGTMDVLCHDTESGLHYKAVAKSPVLYLAEKAASLPGNLLITGNEMGGGSISKVLRQRAQEVEVMMTVSAAATVHHNLEKVCSWGIKIISDTEAEDLRHNKKHSTLTIGDIDVERLKHILKGLGVSFSFDVVGICAQDHGAPPEGISHLDYRHNIFKASLDENPFPHALLYKNTEIPGTLNRLISIADSAKMFPADEIFVMDSGMAAILGATMDPRVKPKEKVLVLDIATSHTVGAAIEGGEIAGFFEYHTHDITLKRLESLLGDLADGKLEHKKVVEEGGHGAYIRKAFGFQAAEIIVATGPKRRLVDNSGLPIVFGAPLGDNMMTGAVGVLEAIRRRKGLKEILYL